MKKCHFICKLLRQTEHHQDMEVERLPLAEYDAAAGNAVHRYENPTLRSSRSLDPLEVVQGGC